MEVLRDNKDSVMAVLEAFVYDPLLSWRLVEGTFYHVNVLYYIRVCRNLGNGYLNNEISINIIIFALKVLQRINAQKEGTQASLVQ